MRTKTRKTRSTCRPALERERQRLVRLRADPRRRRQLEEERLYLADYITALALIDVDSKFEEFKGRLDDLLARGHRVIVFTQYLDTLDFVREKLVARYGERIACYSGRGGEVWDAADNAWRRWRRPRSRPAASRATRRQSTSCSAPTPPRRA